MGGSFVGRGNLGKGGTLRGVSGFDRGGSVAPDSKVEHLKASKASHLKNGGK